MTKSPVLVEEKLLTVSFAEKYGQIFSCDKLNNFTIWEKGKQTFHENETIQFVGTVEELIQSDLFWNNFAKIYYFPKQQIQANQSHFQLAKTFLGFLQNLYASKEKQVYISKIKPNTQIVVTQINI